MSGYEEAVSDPSYAGQILVFSYPLVGNYGVDEARLESDRPWTRAVVMRRCRSGWGRWLAERGVVALEDVDTRSLVRRIRTVGAMRAAIGEGSTAELLARARAEPHLSVEQAVKEDAHAPPPLALEVSTGRPYTVGSGPRVVVLDLGCKRSIIRRLANLGLEVVVVPGSSSADAILEHRPAALVVGNGPGDPAQLEDQVETVRSLLGRVRIFGICLGHQLLAQAIGLSTFKLPFGHRGANHPVRVRTSTRILVTVQNHGFAVAPADAPEVSHLSLNDGTVEGIEGDGFAAVQFHPEASPGPHDALPFFDRIATACRSAPTFATY
jgi:carbamoyl-phosphate synthase small subunit